MKIYWAMALVLATGLTGCGSRSAAARGTPLKPGSFTAYVAQRFRDALPTTASVRVDAPLTLEIQAAHGASTSHLDSLYSACLRAPAECDALVTTQVAQMSAVYTTPDAPLEHEQLRVIVRPAGYMEEYRRNLPSGFKPVATPLPGGFWAIGAADYPTAISTINSHTLEPLKLSPDAALEIGRRNMAASLQAHIRSALAHHKKGVGMILNDPYASSLFAFPDMWAPLVQAAGGDLLVSVPASDVVLFCNGDEPDAAKTLKDDAQDVMQDARRPFAPTVFRWTAKGWVETPA